MSAPRETAYSRRVRELSAEGLTNGDAQAIADMEDLDDTEELPAEPAARRAPWVICASCQGDGQTSAHLGEVHRDEWDADEFQDYLEGAYDAPCGACAGTGKVRADAVPLVRSGRDGQPVFYADADDASEHLLRMAEGLC